MDGRYGVDPSRQKGQKSIVEYVQDVLDRVSSGDASLQVGHSAIEDGDFIVRNGDILVSESDDSVVLRVIHGTVPEVRMYPLGGTDTHHCTIFGADFNLGTGLGPDQSIQMGIEKIDTTQDGGKVLLTKNNAIISHQPAGGLESFFWLNSPTGTQEVLYRGRWSNQFQYDNNMGIYPGVINVGGGFTSWTHSYFTSFATTIAPVVGLVNTAGTVTWNITAMTTSAFTVSWTGTAAKTLNFWNFRVA